MSEITDFITASIFYVYSLFVCVVGKDVLPCYMFFLSHLVSMLGLKLQRFLVPLSYLDLGIKAKLRFYFSAV